MQRGQGRQPWSARVGRRSWWTLQRATAVGVGANSLTALLLTHLHSDHIADVGDLLITRWVTTFTPEQTPLPIIGPPGTAKVVENMLAAFGPDIGYRIAHHADLTGPPAADVRERTDGVVWEGDGVQIRVAPTDHRPVAPTIGFRIEYEGASVVLAGDTVPCESLDRLAARAGALVHTVIDPQGFGSAVATAADSRHLRLSLLCRGGRRDGRPRRSRHVRADPLCSGSRTGPGRRMASQGRIRVRRPHRDRT